MSGSRRRSPSACRSRSKTAGSYQAAVQANRHREQVLGVVAHDLRNPLNVIRLATDSLEPDPGQPERRNRKPAQLDPSCSGSNESPHSGSPRRVEDRGGPAQDRSRPDASDRVPVADRRVVALLAATASLELTLEVERDLRVWRSRSSVSGDRRTSSVMRSSSPREGGRIAVGARSQGDAVIYYVADTGRGIPAENIPHLFERFWQAEPGTHGAGLGLPIVHGLVQALGGRIVG